MGLFSRLVGTAARVVVATVRGAVRGAADAARSTVIAEREKQETKARPAPKPAPAAPTVIDEGKTVKASTVIEEAAARERLAKRQPPIPEEPDFADRAELEWRQIVGQLVAAGLDEWFVGHLELVHEEIELDDAAMLIAEIETPGGRSPKSKDELEDEPDDDAPLVSRRWFTSGTFRQVLADLLSLLLDPALELLELEVHKGEAVAGRRRRKGQDGKPLPKKKKPGPKKKRHGKLTDEEHKRKLAAERQRRYRARKKQAAASAATGRPVRRKKGKRKR